LTLLTSPVAASTGAVKTNGRPILISIEVVLRK
jgi:hypothetical protein